VRERFKPRNINPFDPAAQEYDWDEFLQQSTPKSKRNYVPKSTLFRYRGNSQSLGRALATNPADGNHELALLVPRSTTKRTRKMCSGQLAMARSSAGGRSSQRTAQRANKLETAKSQSRTTANQAERRPLDTRKVGPGWDSARKLETPGDTNTDRRARRK
jgi:hypothetical protein